MEKIKSKEKFKIIASTNENFGALACLVDSDNFQEFFNYASSILSNNRSPNFEELEVVAATIDLHLRENKINKNYLNVVINAVLYRVVSENHFSGNLPRIKNNLREIKRNRDWYWDNRNGIGYLKLQKKEEISGKYYGISTIRDGIKKYERFLSKFSPYLPQHS